MTNKICILGGGWSNEREISLKSSHDVYEALIEQKHDVVLYDMKSDSFHDLNDFIINNSIDLVFNLIHGEGGEDGKVQSYLEKIGINFCGSNSTSSELSFNKYKTKQVWIDHDLMTPKFTMYKDQNYDDLKTDFGESFFIKDICSGSSNNIFRVENENDFKNFTNVDSDREYMVEKRIYAEEYTAAILNNQVLPIIKIIPADGFYDFNAKYKSEKTQFIFPQLEQKIVDEINQEVFKAFNVLGCRTWARVDFFIHNNQIILLEINTIPGMTDHSLVPKSAKQYGLSYYKLILEIMGINA
tara:strand:+ start:49 stop:945 length:897 start_codon:yes stop_codon:yes gene_type:complete